MLVLVEGGKPENPEKNPRSRDENQQQTQPTHDAGSGNRTRATLVGSERSHHCAIPAPLSFLIAIFIAFVAEKAELVILTSSLQSGEKELQQQLNESNEKNHQQFVYITELQTTLRDTDRILKEVSDDILNKRHAMHAEAMTFHTRIFRKLDRKFQES